MSDKFYRRTLKQWTKFSPEGDVSRLYVYRNDGQTSRVSIESCISPKENNIAWYIRHNTEDKIEMDIWT